MELKENEYEFEQHLSIDFDYRGMKITVYRNGEEFYEGLSVVISRRQFRHWIKFLDFLSVRIGMSAPVHRIYTTDGIEIHKVKV
uniref:Doublecortin domain-containing protein n=1 Tax=Syphacia muris TaxID=451379 RepID=A0A0N5ATU1_9BILA